MSYYNYAPYVPVAERRAKAAREMKKLEKKGQKISPVVIEGRTIARNFWGKAWCENLERYSDYESRLPRGRTYVRNGSVVDLQIEPGNVRAMVSGSEIYKVKIEVGTVEPESWKAMCRDCHGSVASLVELLQGKLAKNVMERVCRQGDGLFPAPNEIKMSCSCPDGASMCKHVAAVMYGAGARLDHAPDLLFTLRGVDRAEMIGDTGADLPMTQGARASERVLADDDVAALFGIEMDFAPVMQAPKKGKLAAPARSNKATDIAPAARSRTSKKLATKKNAALKRAAGVEPPQASIKKKKPASITAKKKSAATLATMPKVKPATMRAKTTAKAPREAP